MTTQESQKEVREKLAELEHDQWAAWSSDIAATEQITPARLARWQQLWCPYFALTETQKDQDREWGDKALAIVAKDLDIKLADMNTLHPELESDEYDEGYTQAITDVRNLIRLQKYL